MRANLSLYRVCFKPETAEYKPERADVGPEKADSGSGN